MTYSLTVHTRYKDIELGVYHHCDLLHSAILESKSASKLLIHTISDLLNKANIKLSDLSFIAAHQGPAPFTTLRVSLATVNGLASVSSVALVGVNGLLAAIDQYKTDTDYTLVMLNAFCNDIYYALYEKSTDTILAIGYAPAKELIVRLSEKYAGIFYIIGNGAELHMPGIEEFFGKRAKVDHTISMASLKQISASAYKQFQCSNTEKQLLPIYLKNQFGAVNL